MAKLVDRHPIGGFLSGRKMYVPKLKRGIVWKVAGVNIKVERGSTSTILSDLALLV